MTPCLSNQSFRNRISNSALCLAALILASLACAPLNFIPGTSTPYPCPQATAELFYVEPIPATTSDTALTVRVVLGNTEEITIITESGVFTSPGGDVEVTLRPNTVHHLEVIGQVREVQHGNCTYGGYTLNTTTDKDGNPLVIEQKSP